MLKKLKAVKAESWIWFGCFVINFLIVFPLFLSLLCWTMVSGSSMNPTLEDRDRYIAVAPVQIHQGNVVIADSEYLDQKIIKRVIGVPGDTIAIANGTVYRNGVALLEEYIAEPMVTEDIAPFTLEEDMFFLMGDNRNRSLDSRRIGPVSRDEICYVVPMQHRFLMIVAWLAAVVLMSSAVMMLAELETKGIMRLWRKRAEKETADI